MRVMVHLLHHDPFVAQIDSLPAPQDQYVLVRHPRQRDGKPLSLLADGVTTVLFPWHRITFIEVLDEPSEQINQDLFTIFRNQNPR